MENEVNETVNSNKTLNDASVEAQSALRLFVENLEKAGLYNSADNSAPTINEDGVITLKWSREDIDYVFTASPEGHLSVKKTEGNNTHTVNYPENPFIIFEQLVEKIS